MADILVQNAVNKLKDAIVEGSTGFNYNQIFGRSLADELKAAFEEFPDAGPYAGTGSGGVSKCLCTLSEYQYMTYCQCSYSGAGQNCSCCCVQANVWRNGDVLAGSGGTVAVSTIQSTIRNLRQKYQDLYAVNNADFNQDTYLAWYQLKAVFQAESSPNTAVLSSWYGIGGGSVQGARYGSDYIKVCGSSWLSGEGATCTWTVPAGATQAKFQAWGAGRGSNPGCCCGGQNFSSTGAYAEIEISVTPGDQYVVCAGCSCTRYCCSNQVPGHGCMSGVTGNGICCFKADGAHCYQENCDSLNANRCCYGAGSACRRFQNPWCTSSGICWCGLGEYCYDNSCDTCGVIPTYPNKCYVCGCSCATTTAKIADGCKNTIFGLIGGGCLDTNNYGWHIRPPVINSDTGLEWTGGCYNQSFSSGTCCGGCHGASWNWHPGHGGAGTHIMGGTTNHKGDTGRGGMVQISWQ